MRRTFLEGHLSYQADGHNRYFRSLWLHLFSLGAVLLAITMTVPGQEAQDHDPSPSPSPNQSAAAVSDPPAAAGSLATVQVTGVDETPADVEQAQLDTIPGGASLVPSHFNLLNNRTAAGNISFPMEIAGKSKAERLRRVEECLEIVGLLDKAHTYPAKLSGGQKQRVAIARALANDPKVLLCDEPTSSVDPQMTSTLLGFLKQINRMFGITIVLVTHEVAAVNAICNKVAVMENGRVVERFELNDKTFEPKSNLARFLLQDRLGSFNYLNDYAASA